VIENPTVVLLDVRRVHAPERKPLADPIAGDVVDDSAVFIAQQSVLDPPGFETRQVAAEESIGGGDCIGPFEFDPAHVGGVEESRRFTDRAVLFADGRVLNGQFEAAEFDHAGPEASMGLVERGPLQGHSPVRSL